MDTAKIKALVADLAVVVDTIKEEVAKEEKPVE